MTLNMKVSGFCFGMDLIFPIRIKIIEFMEARIKFLTNNDTHVKISHKLMASMDCFLTIHYMLTNSFKIDIINNLHRKTFQIQKTNSNNLQKFCKINTFQIFLD
jgi:hypothetical protein